MNGTELRKAMHGGERVVGTMTSFIRNPRWAAIYGRLGLDYVIVDTEHSPTNRSEAADLAFAFASVGVCPIIRVPNTHPHETIEGLDAGFQGVLVPYCEEVDEVRAVVAAARMRPLKGALHNDIRDGKVTMNEATTSYLARRNANNVIIIWRRSSMSRGSTRSSSAPTISRSRSASPTTSPTRSSSRPTSTSSTRHRSGASRPAATSSTSNWSATGSTRARASSSSTPTRTP
jgi:hypothetical protein